MLAVIKVLIQINQAHCNSNDQQEDKPIHSPITP